MLLKLSILLLAWIKTRHSYLTLNDYLFIFLLSCFLLLVVTVTRGASSPPALRFACLLASVRAGLIGRPSEARKPASELWSAAITIFQSMAASNLTGSGRSGQKKVQLEPVRNLLPPNAIISRPALVEFVKLIKNPSILQVIPLF